MKRQSYFGALSCQNVTTVSTRQISTSCRVPLSCRGVRSSPIATGRTRRGAVVLFLPREPLREILYQDFQYSKLISDFSVLMLLDKTTTTQKDHLTEVLLFQKQSRIISKIIRISLSLPSNTSKSNSNVVLFCKFEIYACLYIWKGSEH